MTLDDINHVWTLEEECNETKWKKEEDDLNMENFFH